MGRRGIDWSNQWYDFFWDRNCSECLKEIELEKFWSDINSHNSIESRIEKEDNKKLELFERNFFNGGTKHLSKKENKR